MFGCSLTARGKPVSLLPVNGSLFPLGRTIHPGAILARTATAYWDTGLQNDSATTLHNYGTGGSALDAALGAAGGAPLWLPYTGTTYIYFPGIAGNSVTCTAPASATQYAAYPLGGGAPTTGAATGSALFTFSTIGSWLRVDLLNVGNTVVASFRPTTAAQTALTDTFSVVWAVNRASGDDRKTTVVADQGATLLLGTDDYVEAPNNALFNFTTTDSFTLLTVTRWWATPPGVRPVMTKRAGGPPANVGWSINYFSDAAIYTDISDGTNRIQISTPAPTLGSLCVFAGGRSVAADLISASVNAGTIATATDTTTATLSNSEVVRVGRFAGAGVNYGGFVFTAGLVFRRVLTSAEISYLSAYFQNRRF